MGLRDHVAIALDFSEPSELAARAAFVLASLTGAKKLTVLHATRDVVLPAGETPELRSRLEDLRGRLTGAASKQLDELCVRVSAPDCERAVVCGRPSEAIPRALESMDATLLVLGTHARKGLRRVFVGSIAEDLLRGLGIPALVTLVGSDHTPPDEELRALRHIIVGVDLAEGATSVASAVLALFEKLARDRPLTVHLVHSLESREELESLVQGQGDSLKSETQLIAEELRKAEVDRAQGLFERIEPDLRTAGFEVVRHLIEGDFVESVGELTETLPAQLVAVGTHGRHHAPLLELGSTTSRMIRASNVSVLVVPSRAAGPDADADLG